MQKSKALPARILSWSFLMVSLSFFLLLPFQSCSASGLNLTPEQSTMLVTILDEQEKALSEALTLLDEAQNQLNESEQELTLSEQELTAAKEQLLKQRKELSVLTALLKQQSNELEFLSTRLESANQYLTEAKAEIEKSEQKHLRKEASLRCERTLWQVISVVLAGIAVSH